MSGGCARPHYAGKVATRRALAFFREAGLEVGGMDWLPDGTIRLVDRDTAIAISAREAEDRAKALAAPVRLVA